MRKLIILLVVIFVCSFVSAELSISYNSNQPKVVIGSCTDYGCKGAINNWTNTNYYTEICLDGVCATSWDNITSSTTYNAISIVTLSGTLDSGDVDSVEFADDDDTYNVSEVGGANPIEIIVNFTEVEDFNTILIRVWYQGGAGHDIEVGLFDTDDGTYEEEYEQITDMGDYAFININVWDSADHIDANNNVSLRFRHVDNGNTNHDFIIDYAVLIDGFSTTTNQEHDAQSGRDNIENHPWAMDTGASRNFTGDVSIDSPFGLVTDKVSSRSGDIISMENDTNVTGNFNVSEHLNVEKNASFGSGDSLRGVGVDFGGVYYYLNDDGQRVYNRTDEGDVRVNGTVCDMNGCIGDQTVGDPIYLTCGENAVLDDASFEWSCGGNGEIGQYIHIFEDATITNLGLYCNTVLGAVNITMYKYDAPVVDIGCNLVDTAPASNSCSVDVDAGDMIQPYTVTDTGHAFCVLTIRLETR